MKRLDTINFTSIHKVVDYNLPKYKSGKYVVDDSCFVPMSEAIRQLGSNGSNGTNEQLLYDFNDGRDNGMPVPATRTKNVKDIAEISTHIMEQTEEMSEKIKESKKHYDKVKAFEASMESAKSSVKTTGDSVTPKN